MRPDDRQQPGTGEATRDEEKEGDAEQGGRPLVAEECEAAGLLVDSPGSSDEPRTPQPFGHGGGI